MEKLVTTAELMVLEHPLPDNAHVVAFKLVNFGPNTLAEAGRAGKRICEIADQQPSFFIISDRKESMREAMHELVDRFCDKTT